MSAVVLRTCTQEHLEPYPLKQTPQPRPAHLTTNLLSNHNQVHLPLATIGIDDHTYKLRRTMRLLLCFYFYWSQCGRPACDDTMGLHCGGPMEIFRTVISPGRSVQLMDDCDARLKDPLYPPQPLEHHHTGTQGCPRNRETGRHLRGTPHSRISHGRTEFCPSQSSYRLLSVLLFQSTVQMLVFTLILPPVPLLLECLYHWSSV